MYKEIVNINSSTYNDSTVFIGSIFYNPIYFGAYTDSNLDLESEPISCFKKTFLTSILSMLMMILIWRILIIGIKI